MDNLQKLYFDKAAVRGETVILGPALEAAVEHQNLPTAVKTLVGEMAASALLCAAALEFDGSVVLQAQGDDKAPVRLIVVDVSKDLSFRINVTMRGWEEGISEKAGLRELLNPAGGARCALILDASNRPNGEAPYQGIVVLEGDSFAEAMEQYFARSEQVETTLRLASDGKRAGGVMVQKLPSTGGVLPEDFDADGWERVRLFAKSAKDEELLTLEPEEMNRRLFWEESPRVTLEKPIAFRCTCSPERIENILLQFDRKELLEKGSKDLTVTCRFCGKQYVFTQADIDRIFEENHRNHPRPS